MAQTPPTPQARLFHFLSFFPSLYLSLPLSPSPLDHISFFILISITYLLLFSRQSYILARTVVLHKRIFLPHRIFADTVCIFMSIRSFTFVTQWETILKSATFFAVLKARKQHFMPQSHGKAFSVLGHFWHICLLCIL